jgi:hypothetical protein
VWYLAEILFAEPPRRDDAEYRCESCNVVLRADDAAQAYQKAIAWGAAYSAESASTSKLLGVAHLTSIGEELSDGVEICGRFFEAPAVWERVDEYIPPPEQLAAIRWGRAATRRSVNC